MKLIALLGAGAIAAGSMMAAAPADAQRYGYHDGGSYGRDHYRPEHRGYRGGYGDGYGHPRGHGRGYGAHGGAYGFHGGGYGRGRLVCRVRHGYYGPVRRCFRIHR